MKHLKLYEEILFSKNRKLYNTILNYIKSIDPGSIQYEEVLSYSTSDDYIYSFIIKNRENMDVSEDDPWSEEINKNDKTVVIAKSESYLPPGFEYYILINNETQNLYQHEIKNLYNKLRKKYLEDKEQYEAFKTI